MPEPSLWRSWSALVNERLAPFLPAEVVQHRGQTVIVMGWRGTVEVESRSSDDGELCLSSVSLPSWQAVVLPRIRDGADDELTGDIAKQLDDLAEGHRIALDQWMDCIAELRGRLDFSIPSVDMTDGNRVDSIKFRASNGIDWLAGTPIAILPDSKVLFFQDNKYLESGSSTSEAGPGISHP